jgi:hypothetical protein
LNRSVDDDGGGSGAAHPATITITDRRHPLYGKCLQVVSVTSAPTSRGHVFVTYGAHGLLRIPVTATSLRPAPPVIGTKLTVQALAELVACLREAEEECRSSPVSSGGGFPPQRAKRSSKTSRRRSRR